MYRKVKKSIAVILCVATCMTTRTDIYAWNSDSKIEEAVQPEPMTEKETESDEEAFLTEPESETEEVRTEMEETGSAAESGANLDEMGTGDEINTEEPATGEGNETESGTDITEPDTQPAEVSTETENETDIGVELETDDIIIEADIEEVMYHLRDELNQRLKSDGFVPSGYIDSGIEAESLGWGEVSMFSMSESFIPAKYSAVDNGLGTSIKNQGNWGSCWSFAAVATAESIYKKITGEGADMSESHLVNFFYNDDIAGPDGGLEGDAVIPLATVKVNNGGNNMFTTFAMARWTGMADEKAHESLVYPSPEETGRTKELDIPQEYAYTDLVHMQNAYWINKSDANAVKQAIMDYGAVATYYKHDESYSSNYVDKSEYGGPTVYYNRTVDFGENHAIAIVGWDDEFDRNNFNYTAINHAVTQKDIPENNGAWLIKNSWGTGYGDDGYFWMSYEDRSLSDTMLAFGFESAGNYDHIYQYDGSAGVRYQSADTITAAAVYTGTGYQMIKAVGIGVASVSTDYTVEIYTNLTDENNPQSGILSTQTSGNTLFQGYHTIPLEKWVPVTEGERFSVVITLSGGKIDGEPGTAIFVDQSYDNGRAVRFVAKTNPGETFIKSGENWTDAASEDKENKITYRIKAYTADGEFDAPQEDRQLTPEMVKEIEDQEYNGTQNEPLIEINYMGEPLVRDVDFRVEYINNGMAADKENEAAPKAVITGIGKYTGTVEQTFTILRKDITEEMVTSDTMPYNGAVQDDLTLRNGDIRLVKGTDYTIVFNKQPCNAGSYMASITGMNNYAGEVNIPITIAKTTISEEMVTMAEGADIIPVYEFTGTAIKPSVRIIVNGMELPSGSYSVSYKNNMNVGENASVTVTGKGNCQGKVTKNFQIIPRHIEQDMSVTVAKATYSGKELTPAVTVKWDKKTLKKGRDYSVAYVNNINASDSTDIAAPTAVITGMGNYTGIIQQEFSILPKETAESSISVQIAYGNNGSNVHVSIGKTELSEKQYNIKLYKAGTTNMAGPADVELGEKYDAEVELTGNYKVKSKTYAYKKNLVCRRDIGELDIRFADENAAYVYNAKAYKPKLVIKDADGNTVSGACYTISYADNTNAGTAKAIVTGKGNYAGTKQLLFSIEKKVLSSITIPAIKDQTYVGKAISPAVKLKGNGVTLKAGKDYTCTYGNNVDVSYDSKGAMIAGAYAEIQLSGNYEIAAQDNTDGHYGIAEGTKDRIIVNYKIIPAKISAITLSKAYYTGQAVLPDNITVKAGKLEVPEDCYEITAENNIEVSSKASLTVTAKTATNFTGSKTKKFSVAKLELKKLILPVIPDQPYLNRPVTAEGYAIKDLNGQDIGTDQYDVTYKNNKKPGTATVTYKSRSDGLYKGSATVRFNITKATMAQAIDYDAAGTVEKQYTGSGITLTDDELRLIAPIKDTGDGYLLPYTVAYSKNVNAGKAVVRLTGTDYLQGSTNVYFTITPKPAGAFEITTGPKQLSYNNGLPVYLELKEVKDNGMVLKAGKDFTCSYINADKKGVACLTITGVGNYSGTRFVYYNIG